MRQLAADEGRLREILAAPKAVASRKNGASMIRPGAHNPSGWMFDGTQNIWHDGSGLFWVGGRYYFRPDLLQGMPPPPPTPVERAKLAIALLRTPWPSYEQTWQQAKQQRWISRYYAIFGFPLWAYLLITTSADSLLLSVPYLLGRVLFFLSWPGAFWVVHYRDLCSVGTHKAFAFLAATYGATSVGAKAANVRPVPAPMGVSDLRGGWLVPPGAQNTFQPRVGHQ